MCFSVLSRARDGHATIGVRAGGVADCFRFGGRFLQRFRSVARTRSCSRVDCERTVRFNQVGIQPGDTIWQINRPARLFGCRYRRSIRSDRRRTRRYQWASSRGANRSSVLLRYPAVCFRSHWKRAQSSFSRFGMDAALPDVRRVDADDRAARTWPCARAPQKSRSKQDISKSRSLLRFLLTLGLVFTAMRTVIVAFVIGASVIALRSLRGVEGRLYVSRCSLCLLSALSSCGKHAIEMRCCWAIRARHCVCKSRVLGYRAS